MLRRSLLLSSSGFILLAACATSTVNGVTYFKIDLKTIDAYAQAIQNATSILLAVPLISTALGTKASIISTALSDIASSIASLDQANEGVTTLEFTLSSVPATLTAIQTDAKTIFSDLKTVILSLGTQIASNISSTFVAFETIYTLLIALTSITVSTSKTPMSEEQALTVLNVKQ